MKIKGLFFLLIVFCCISCTIPHRLVINGQREIVLSDECGIVIIESRTLGTPLSTYIVFRFNGEYYINTDYLKIEMEHRPNETILENLYFRFRGEDFARKEVETISSDILSVQFNLRFVAGDLLILPTNFITCNGKPVIADTIRIQVRF